MKKNTFFEILVLLIAAIPVFYLAFIYNSLPETVPTHFGITGKPNAFGNKSSLWITVSIMSVLSIGIYLLVTNISKIDPKKSAKLSAQTFQKIAIGVVLLLSAVNISIIYSTANGMFNTKLFFPLLGLFFIYMGNMMHSIKPNYFVGIRLPWTLEDPNNWRATHQLSGKLWFVGGIIITLCTLLLPEKIGSIIFICLVAVIVLIPIIYSYSYFKKHKQVS
jgi:uncharacterized membrane protein